ncbi:type VI secretion system baseplate subunit TssE [Achromobacter sp. SD115]|uniref:Type VI secretion system, lysozyme-related family protein 2 n=1 Tax=Achromobacter xylosoxidans (strain A8) TaxID=762376 RepID=E3HRR7_ACHXA|nr:MULTISPECIES: type VI secretion system baseplate subunit TssE [Achromobacter]ADP19686.1 type VI secretion system, lysozyme-related family protein 2 [Achromobacter xylosoxidans A8]MBO1014156.1 type VI secretion system baseplate subunit TssE [Achromobacter sp. SD115]
MGHADRPGDWEPLSRGQRAARDRLQPSLLDRLMDNDPAKREEPRENAMLTHEALRAAVLRDLRWLLNTVNLQASQDLSAHRPVAASALNFGVRAMAGKRMSEIDWIDVEESIREAIAAFEPRILRSSVEVRCVSDAGTLEHHNVLSLEIRGMLWCVPQPLEFLFRTDIDLESGHMDLRDLGGA